ncbi:MULTISPECIES: XRE family transcriptional regulator [unclassified Microcoleus]|uniref:nucleotide exchange factor GrpE n=1 Tax=unclassified Microcoleus TaxID=2642155 RepID=UPI0025ECAEE7|nr:MULTISPECIES: XRE family transcriptional regulator [unclassified Microcoleus]
MFYFLGATVDITTGPAFGIALAVGGIFLILVYLYAASEAGDAIDFKYDTILRERMNQLDIVDWQDLGEKAGLSRFGVRLVRQGDVGKLTLDQLRRLATVLNLNFQEFDRTLSALPSTGTTANPSEIEELKQQCFRLREELQQQKTQLTADFRRATFEQLQTLLTNYPSARKMAEAKPNMPAKNLSALFTPLENLLSSWDFETIGSAWEQVAYNPQLHQPDVEDITEGELVYIRFVGYRDKEQILAPAKVSRSLPPGITN